MASGSQNMTTYKARLLASTPNNTTTFLRGDNTWSNEISGGLLKVTNNSNTVTMGSANAQWCHFENSADIPFYFNKAIHPNGGCTVYNTNSWIRNGDLRINDAFRVAGGKTWINTNGNSLTSHADYLEIRSAYTDDTHWPVCIKNAYNANATGWGTGIKIANGSEGETGKWIGIRAYANSAYSNQTVMDFYAVGDRRMRLTTDALMPAADNTYYIGDSTTRWLALYAHRLDIVDDSANNSTDATVYVRHRSNNDWNLKLDADGYDYGLNIVTKNDAANALVTPGNIKGHAIWANQGSNGERDVGVDSTTSGQLYLYAHTTGKGLYSGSGYKASTDIITINTSGVAFYGILSAYDSAAATDFGGLSWNNRSAASSATVNANDCPTNAWWYILRNRHTNTSNNYYTDLAIPFNDGNMYYKIVRNNAIVNSTIRNGWIQLLDQLNYNNYSPTLTGGGASGTWGISISGNAATATALTSNAGSGTQPIYFSGGKPVATSYALNATVNAASIKNTFACYSGTNAIRSYPRIRNIGSARYPIDIYLYNDAGNAVAELWYDSGDATNFTLGRWNFLAYSPKSTADTATTGKYEYFYLPDPTKDRTSNASYAIRTSKSSAYNVDTATRINGNLAAATSNVDHNIWVSSTAAADGIPNYIASFYMNPSTNVFTVPSSTRISPSGGALYLGNSNNNSWVYVQDMASQASGTPWKLTQAGVLTCVTVNANLTGNVTGNVTGNCSGSSGSCTGNAATASKVGEAASWLYFNHSNEVNFGGTNTDPSIYFGYRATDSRPKPTNFIFGSGNGTATVKAATFIGALTGNVTGNCSGTAGGVAWSNVSSKPATATRWPSWSEVTSKPTLSTIVAQGRVSGTSTTVDLTSFITVGWAFQFIIVASNWVAASDVGTLGIITGLQRGTNYGSALTAVKGSQGPSISFNNANSKVTITWWNGDGGLYTIIRLYG